MSKASSVKECDIFNRARKTSSRSTKTALLAEDTETSYMADLAAVLTELKALRSEFGSELDGIVDRLGEMANSIATLEDNLGTIRRDVSANEKRIDEAEARITATEEQAVGTDAKLTSAVKRIAYLEAKTEDLENRGRRKNIRLFGLKEAAEGRQPLLDFVRDRLSQWLGLDPDKPLTLERVHRTLGPPKPNQYRAVLIRFLSFQDKELVLRSARQRNITYDGSKLTFAQDLSVETIRQRCQFDNVKKLFLDAGSFRGFHPHPCKLRVLHKGKIHLLSSPQEAEEFHRNTTVE